MLVAGFLLPVSGSWVLADGCSLLVRIGDQETRNKKLDAGFWLLDAGSLSPVVGFIHRQQCLAENNSQQQTLSYFCPGA